MVHFSQNPLSLLEDREALSLVQHLAVFLVGLAGEVGGAELGVEFGGRGDSPDAVVTATSDGGGGERGGGRGGGGGGGRGG